MKTISKAEALALYAELTTLAQGFADALGTTPDKCNDPICIRWRKFEGVLELEDGMLLLLTDDDSPLFILTEFHITGNENNGGIMSVEESIFECVHRTDKVLTVEYNDGGIEFFANHKGMKDVYHFHSAGNRNDNQILLAPDL
jgi:hypothetical protein